MTRLKSFITRYSKVYIGLVLLDLIGFLLLPWGSPILGERLTSSAYRKFLLVLEFCRFDGPCCPRKSVPLFLDLSVVFSFG